MICEFCGSEDCKEYFNCIFCFTCNNKFATKILNRAEWAMNKELLEAEGKERCEKTWNLHMDEVIQNSKDHVEFVKSLTVKPNDWLSEEIEAREKEVTG